MFACIHIPNFSGEVHTALLDCASAFSPRVENTAPGTVVFDLEGLERLFGSYSEIAEKVAGHVRAAGIQAHVAVASNPDAAVVAARGFAGVIVLGRGTESKRLRDLPLDVLSPSPEILETLNRWGIRTIGAFRNLPVVQVSERLGQEGVRLHKLARGASSRPLVPHREGLRFMEVMELEYELGTIEPLTFILSRMLDQICSRLRTRDLATHEVRLVLGIYVRVLHLPVPVRNPKLLTKLLILDLEAHPPGAPIQQVKVEAIPTKPRAAQNGLFVPLSPEPEKLELTLARIAAVVGEENVGSPEVLDTYRPDAFRVKKFGLARNERGLKPATTCMPTRYDQNVVAGFSPRSFAFRLFRPPLEATVQLRNSIPSWIAFQGVHGPIQKLSGPWRSSGDWWRPNSWDREEWDIEVHNLNVGPTGRPLSVHRLRRPPGLASAGPPTSDALYRIYYDVHTDRWFAEGVYD
jgi:protein ImuB